MSKIKFSTGPRGEWDKLKPENRVIGRGFTTARGFTNPKEVYYRKLIDTVIDIEEEGNIIGKAYLKFTDCAWVHHTLIEWWRKDMYTDTTLEEVGEFMEMLYKTSDPFVIKLYLEWTEVY